MTHLRRNSRFIDVTQTSHFINLLTQIRVDCPDGPAAYSWLADSSGLGSEMKLALFSTHPDLLGVILSEFPDEP